MEATNIMVGDMVELTTVEADWLASGGCDCDDKCEGNGGCGFEDKCD